MEMYTMDLEFRIKTNMDYIYGGINRRDQRAVEEQNVRIERICKGFREKFNSKFEGKRELEEIDYHKIAHENYEYLYTGAGAGLKSRQDSTVDLIFTTIMKVEDPRYIPKTPSLFVINMGSLLQKSLAKDNMLYGGLFDVVGEFKEHRDVREKELA